MKKLFKKIGVFGLFLSVLSPFVESPLVNAEGADCEYHSQDYLFMDVSYLNFDAYYDEDGGYRTYTSFEYTFPEVADDEVITIESVGEVPLDTVDDLKMFWDDYTSLVNKGVTESSAIGRYSKDIERYGETITQKFKNSDYESVTTLLHGYWSIDPSSSAEADDDDSEKKLASYDFIDNKKETFNLFKNHTMQNAFNRAGIKLSELKVTVGGAKLYGDNYSSAGSRYTTDAKEYLQYVVEDVSSGQYASEDANYVFDDEGKKFINFNIEREIDQEVIDEELTFGNCDKEKCWIYSTVADKVTNSYEAFKNITFEEPNKTPTCKAESDCHFIEYDKDGNAFEEKDIDVLYSDYYLYWPVVYNVEYSVCKTNGDITQTPVDPSTPAVQKWTLKYDDNVTDTSVANMPSNPASVALKTEITVDSKIPTRKGFAFNGWNTQPDGKGTNYKAGDKITRTEANAVVTLYAQWGPEGTTENPKQGVISYVVGFLAVGLVAGGIYLVSKKKNLFKQI